MSKGSGEGDADATQEDSRYADQVMLSVEDSLAIEVEEHAGPDAENSQQKKKHEHDLKLEHRRLSLEAGDGGEGMLAGKDRPRRQRKKGKALLSEATKTQVLVGRLAERSFVSSERDSRAKITPATDDAPKAASSAETSPRGKEQGTEPKQDDEEGPAPDA